jgi:TRAP transporter 4TM/12TM fusion protein
VVAVFWSIIQLYDAATFTLDIFQLEVIHLCLALVLVFLLKPAKGGGNFGALIDYGAVALALASGIYFLCEYERIITRMRFADPVLAGDIILGAGLIILCLEAGRRLLGWGLSVLGAVAILYAFLGFLLPGSLAHRSVDIINFSEFMILTQEGVFGVPLRVSATFVFLFILFGAFLKHGKLGQFYNDLAMAVAGGFRGGSAKVAVISSSLLGTISGSATANVTTSGTFTIPMMIRGGYRPASAGAIEALASTGGQLVPPIMGAAAFIMAELTGIKYWDIALVAIVPSVLYYVAVYMAVHYEAVRMGLRAEASAAAGLGRMVLRQLYMMIPVAVIVIYLASGYTVSMSAMMAIVSCVLIQTVSILARKNWSEFATIVRALEDGGKNTVSVAIPCAIAGIIVGVLTLTGLGLKFSTMIMSLSSGSPALLWLFAALICLVLGMGMPSSAAYITVAILAIPALIKSGASVLTAHFFGFYWSNLSMITPPVALAAYAAAGIAKADSNQVGYRACFLGMALYILPFLFVTYPGLLLQGGWQSIILDFLKAAVVMIYLPSAYMGVLFCRATLAERLLCLLAIALLWVSQENIWLNLLGYATAAAPAVSNYKRWTAQAA